ncbi:universal stress protein [Rubrivirga sp. S365]|uniref:universal stress protein n=1 Tax=Rubrivirga sp. S365 TaxID=3076080 RepID=UPI0028C578F7|nr:universal stress protein [Rubrivirga sp. S365]MDT7857399.1 universal stress protein [Rubrivirga sp. S365]
MSSFRFHVQTVLFPTDDSPAAEAARPLAERLAERHGAALHVLRVQIIPPALADPSGTDSTAEADGVVEATRRAPTAADAIVRYAGEVDADVVVMGSHGRSGWNRLTLGSTAEDVLRQADCPVLTVGPEADAERGGPVLAPLAFESASDLALETAVALAEERGTRVVALHVVEPVQVPAPYGMTFGAVDLAALNDRVTGTLRRWVAPYADGPVPVDVEVRHGIAAHAVLDAAAELGAGLVVQASHGRRGLSRWLLGSVAEEVARRAPCPVLTLRIGGAGGARAEAAPPLAVPRADWPDLFDALSRRAAGSPHEVSVDVVSPDAAGPVLQAVPLVGITYDPREDAIDVMAEGAEHRVARPFAVRSEAGAWTLDAALDPEAPGPWALDVVGPDGTRERIVVRPTDAA